MIARAKSGVQVIAGLVILAGIVGGAGWLIYTSITEAPAVVAATVTGLVALLGLAFQRHLDRKREDEKERRERMTPIYEELVTTFYSGAGGGEVAESELTAFFNQLAQRLLLWGDPSIIDSFNQWRLSIDSLAEGAAESLFHFEQLLYAMRADLGQSNSGLGRGDLLRVFINDLDDFASTDESP